MAIGGNVSKHTQFRGELSVTYHEIRQAYIKKSGPSLRKLWFRISTQELWSRNKNIWYLNGFHRIITNSSRIKQEQNNWTSTVKHHRENLPIFIRPLNVLVTKHTQFLRTLYYKTFQRCHSLWSVQRSSILPYCSTPYFHFYHAADMLFL